MHRYGDEAGARACRDGLAPGRGGQDRRGHLLRRRRHLRHGTPHPRDAGERPPCVPSSAWRYFRHDRGCHPSRHLRLPEGGRLARRSHRPRPGGHLALRPDDALGDHRAAHTGGCRGRLRDRRLQPPLARPLLATLPAAGTLSAESAAGHALGLCAAGGARGPAGDADHAGRLRPRTGGYVHRDTHRQLADLRLRRTDDHPSRLLSRAARRWRRAGTADHDGVLPHHRERTEASRLSPRPQVGTAARHPHHRRLRDGGYPLHRRPCGGATL